METVPFGILTEFERKDTRQFSLSIHDYRIARFGNWQKFGDAATKPGSWVQWCKISPDNQSIYYLTRENQLHGASIRGDVRWSHKVRSENWSEVALSPDGNTIVAADPNLNSNDVLIIDAKTGVIRDTWKNLLERPVARFIFTPDGQQVLVINGTSSKFISATDGKPVDRPMLEGLAEPHFSSDGNALYSSRWFKQIEPVCFQYDLATGKKIEFRLPPNGCMLMTPNPKFPVLVTHDNVRELQFWDSKSGPSQKPIRIDMGDKVHRFAWTPEGRYLIVAIKNRVLVLRLPMDIPLSNWTRKLTADSKGSQP